MSSRSKKRQGETRPPAHLGPVTGRFSSALLPWYHAHQRDLPWRRTQDPYAVWLSEVILQQTRVDQGLAYWSRFMDRFPTVNHLAQAHEDEVLKLWQGLGYYSRARNLLTAARQVANEHHGRFPETLAGLLELKGVGDYTAAAIASICFGRPDAVVDGNVYRVLARVFGIDTPIDSTEGRRRFRALAQELIDVELPGEHNQAMMELGATVCTPKNPACSRCPLQPHCAAYATGRIAELPRKQGTTRTRDRFFNYLHFSQPVRLYLQQRQGKDIWQGLWEPPLIESKKPLTAKAMERELNKAFGNGWAVHSRTEEVKHVLSHQVIRAVFWEVQAPRSSELPGTWALVKKEAIDGYAVPRLIERWLEGRRS